MATAAGIPATICNGLRAGALGRALGGGAGWARASRPQRGALLELQALAALRQAVARDDRAVDAGAARALRDGGTSLLPVGVIDVRGGFDAGDAVHVSRGRGGDRQGDQQLLRRPSCAGSWGMKSGAGARGAAAGDRRGRAPRLLRARLTVGPLRAGRRLRYRRPRAPRSRPDVAGGLRHAHHALAAAPRHAGGRRPSRRHVRGRDPDLRGDVGPLPPARGCPARRSASRRATASRSWARTATATSSCTGVPGGAGS